MATPLDVNILDNFGGVNENNLLNVLQRDNDGDNDLNLFSGMKISNYCIDSDIAGVFSDKFNQFSVLSLNCQSISAKFDKLCVLFETLNQMNCQFILICLQETWLIDDSDLSLYQLNNYKCISQGKYCSEHGGLIMYLHDTFSYEPHNPDFKSDIWEGQFINVNIGSCNKYLYVANIYRPPMFNDTNEVLERYNDEII